MGLIKNKRIVLGYILTIMITVVLRFSGFSLVSYEAIVLKYIFFSIFTITVGIHFYKRKVIYKRDTFIITGLSILTLFLIRDSFLLAMLITLIVWLILTVVVKKFDGKRVFQFVTLLISSCSLLVSTILGVSLFALGILLSDFGKTEEIRSVPSPNGSYSLVLEKVDQGALGGNTLINVKHSYFGMVEWKRRIYIGRWGEQPNLEWVGNYEVSVNGEQRGIFFGTTLDKR
jgi:hypothetical protein